MQFCQSAHILRGLAALAVAWFHFTNAQPLFVDRGSTLGLSGSYGYLGVPVFFVVSGFVIPYALDGMKYRFPGSMLEFIKRRFWRIYPTYIVALILTVLITYASSLIPWSKATLPTLDAKTVLGHLTYTTPWLGADWIIPIFWSLAIEIQFYLLMVFLAPALLSRKKIVLLATLLGLSCAALIPSSHTLLFWYLPAFSVGICWYLLYTNRLATVDASAQALGFIVLAWFTMGLDYSLATALTFGALALPIRAPLPLLSFLGTISYSIYLSHSLVGGRIINLATRLPHNPTVQIIVLTLAMAGSILASYILWRFVEERSVRIGRTAARARDQQGQEESPRYPQERSISEIEEVT